MLAGAVSTAVSLLGLAWAREIVRGFSGLFGADPASRGVKVSSIVFAIILVYILDIAINIGIIPYPFYSHVANPDSSPGRHPRFHCG